jgi:hypothetical protein
MYHVRPCPIKIHGHPKFTIQKNKTNQEKRAQPTMYVLPTAPITLNQNSVPVNPRYYHDEDNDTPCYKDFRIDGAAAL